MAAHGLEPPHPLPDNLRAWSAFVRVCHCRHAPMGQPWMPNWSDIKPVLELYDQWTPEIHTRLTVCFTALMTLEAETRKDSNV